MKKRKRMVQTEEKRGGVVRRCGVRKNIGMGAVVTKRGTKLQEDVEV